ncbi:SDR family oxidoreductase [Streptomyces sp. NPDC054787]
MRRARPPGPGSGPRRPPHRTCHCRGTSADRTRVAWHRVAQPQSDHRSPRSTGPARKTRSTRQCVPRRGRPEDVAALVAFLVGPSASFITGQSVHVEAAGCCTARSTSKETKPNDRTSPSRSRNRGRHDAGHPPHQAGRPRVLGAARRRGRGER